MQPAETFESLEVDIGVKKKIFLSTHEKSRQSVGSESGKLVALALDKVRSMTMANIREEQEVHLVAHGTSGSTTGEDTSR